MEMLPYSSGDVKAIAIGDRNAVIAAIIHLRGSRLSEVRVQKSAAKVRDSESRTCVTTAGLS